MSCWQTASSRCAADAGAWLTAGRTAWLQRDDARPGQRNLCALHEPPPFGLHFFALSPRAADFTQSLHLKFPRAYAAYNNRAWCKEAKGDRAVRARARSHAHI